MGSRPKRKFEPSEDRDLDENARNIPNSETQDLYNTMRELEDGVSFDQQLQLQSRGPANEYPGHLRPPSQAPTSPRSPASTTHSVTGALAEVELHDEEQQPNKKRRAVRHGSLEPVQRAKAALMRKIGACADCKARKVQCGHFDRALFEEGYQAKRRLSRMPAAGHPFFEPAVTTPVSQPSYDPSFNGVGDWQSPLTHAPPTTQHEDQTDNISLEPALSPATTGSFLSQLDMSFNRPPYSAGYSSSSPSSPYRPAAAAVSSISRDASLVPIGRRVTGGWECRHGGDESPGVEACTYRAATPDDLFRHFDAMHSTITSSYRIWKCIQPSPSDPSQPCGYLSSEPSISCLQCSSDVNTWENWFYGTVADTPSLVSGTSSRVPSRDGSAGWGLPPNYQPFSSSWSQGPYNPHMLFPGRQFGGAGQSGSHHSYGAAKSAHCFRGVGAAHPRGCPKGGRCLKRSSTADLGAKASLSFLMVLTFLSLVLTPGMPVTTRAETSLAGLLESASSISLMSFVCITAGLAGMWLFKHVRFRLGQDPGDSCHQRCLARDLLGVESRFDVEDAGSMMGEEMAEVDGEKAGIVA
ncbi:hypothetical protein OQA88_4533 [Cercophora sp. LCS_1]